MSATGSSTTSAREISSVIITLIVVRDILIGAVLGFVIGAVTAGRWGLIAGLAYVLFDVLVSVWVIRLKPRRSKATASNSS
jgi:F0F1-type ATP synthase assembly protein I